MRNNNEKAFALHIPTQEGMDLRDYFAAKALQGMVVNAGRNGLLPLDAGNKGAKEKVATLAYGFADAMIEARDE